MSDRVLSHLFTHTCHAPFPPLLPNALFSLGLNSAFINIPYFLWEPTFGFLPSLSKGVLSFPSPPKVICGRGSLPMFFTNLSHGAPATHRTVVSPLDCSGDYISSRFNTSFVVFPCCPLSHSAAPLSLQKLPLPLGDSALWPGHYGISPSGV